METRILASIFLFMVFSLIAVFDVDAVTLTNNPGACSGQWNNCVNAFGDNVNRAKVSANNSVNRSGRWQAYGFSVPASATIDSVKVRADFYASNFRGHINVRVSGDGGATLGLSHPLGGNRVEQTFWIDVSNDVAWTPATLNNANFRVNVTCFKNQSGSNPTCNLDYLPVEVVYTPFDFSVGVNPASSSVAQARNAQTTVSVVHLGGVPQNVVLSSSGCPPAATCSFNTSSGTPSYDALFTVATSSSTPTGNYVVNITGTGDGKSRSVLSMVTVTDSQPLADALASPLSGVAPLLVNFTSNVNGGDSPLTYFWDFKDGSNSSQQNPAHTFTAAGSYNVSFRVTDYDGDVSTDYVVITVQEPFDFSVSGPTSAGVAQGRSVGISVNVFLESGTSENVNMVFSGCPASATCSYTPGSGAPNFFPSFNVTNTLNTPAGSYPINLSGTGGGKSHSYIFTVNVTDSQPQATPSANPSSGIAPLAVNFTGSFTGGDPTFEYFWNFTDGGTSTQQHPQHTFTAAGTYNVSFKVSDFDGDFSVAYVLVNATNAACIRANPLVDVIPLSQNGTAGQMLNYATQVSNQDSSACPSSVFDFDAVNPPGWTGFFYGDLVTVAPGGVNSTTYFLVSPAPGNGSNSTGLHNFTIYATNQFAYPTYQGNKLAFYNLI